VSNTDDPKQNRAPSSKRSGSMVSMVDWGHSYFSTTRTANSVACESMAVKTFSNEISFARYFDTIFGFANDYRSRVAFQLEFGADPKGFFLQSGSIVQNLWQHTRVFHDVLLSHRTIKRTLNARTPHFDSASATNQPTLVSCAGINFLQKNNK
jgi:hypothetical protein